MVIVIGNRIDNLSSGQSCCISLCANALEKGMNPSVLPPVISK